MDKRMDFTLDDHACHLIIHGEDRKNLPLIYWGMMDHEEGKDSVTELMNLLSDAKPFVLVAFEPLSWNRDFSPWKEKAVFGDEDFEGGGPSFLSFLCDRLIPHVEETLGDRNGKRFIMGYSLAGLFSAWAFYEREIFYGMASASGSLWFSGFTDYVLSHPLKEEHVAYLSLGSKEERTKNPVMARIGDLTKQMNQILKENPKIVRIKYELNSGGHFANVQRRMEKAVRWLLDQDR